MSKIWAKFLLDLSKIKERFEGQILSKIWVRFEQDLCKFFVRFEQDSSKIWGSNFEQDLSKISARFYQDFSKIWERFEQDLRLKFWSRWIKMDTFERNWVEDLEERSGRGLFGSCHRTAGGQICHRTADGNFFKIW